MSTNLDPSTWRLRTDGGIPYKLIEGHPTGSFDAGDAGMTEKCIILGSDLEAFLLESFPLATVYLDGTWDFGVPRRCSHFNRLFTKGITFEPFPSDKPGDPALIDAAAPGGTYSRFLTLTINYVGMPAQPGDEEQEGTFREVSASAGAEFLTTNPVGLEWESGIPHKNMQFRLPKLIPLTSWTVRYPNIDRRIVALWMVKARPMMGRVNSKVMPLFINAPKETILFLGMSASGAFSYRGRLSAPMTLDLKFTEKNAGPGEDGKDRGHNHFYRDEDDIGWDRPQIGKKKRSVYEEVDLNQLIL